MPEFEALEARKRADCPNDLLPVNGREGVKLNVGSGERTGVVDVIDAEMVAGSVQGQVSYVNDPPASVLYTRLAVWKSPVGSASEAQLDSIITAVEPAVRWNEVRVLRMKVQ
jgi:hypothetical protein